MKRHLVSIAVLALAVALDGTNSPAAEPSVDAKPSVTVFPVVARIAEAFGKHLGGHPIKTQCAVFAQFVGTPTTGVKAIRTIVVDKSGKVLLAESADKAQLDKTLLPPKDPMTCCVFVSRRL